MTEKTTRMTEKATRPDTHTTPACTEASVVELDESGLDEVVGGIGTDCKIDLSAPLLDPTTEQRLRSARKA